MSIQALFPLARSEIALHPRELPSLKLFLKVEKRKSMQKSLFYLLIGLIEQKVPGWKLKICLTTVDFVGPLSV